MQYLLSEAEYLELESRPGNMKVAIDAVLMDLCTKVSDHMPVKSDGNCLDHPWGCFKSKSVESYCDECPVQEECPESNKQWSK